MRNQSRPDYMAPARPASVGSDVFVPLLQAVVTGIAGGIIAALVVVAAGWSWWLPLVVALVVFVWMWVKLVAEHNEHLWTKEWYQVEDKPGPAAIQHVTRLTVNVAGGRIVEADFPVAHDVMVKIARGVVNASRPFSEREWSGEGRLLSSPAEFRELRDKLMDMELLTWRNPERRNLGTEWTAEGWATLEAMAAGDTQADQMVRNG